MKTIFDQAVKEELIARVNSLNSNSNALWGKMNVYEMTKHCAIWNEWILGRNNLSNKQGLLGKIFGKMALKSNIKDDKPLGKNMPTASGFTVKQKDGDLDAQKKVLVDLLTDFEAFSNDQFIHSFFGKMTREQIGIFVYKHCDHHLRQFNV